MSAMSLALLLAAGTATAAGTAALYSARGLRRQITALRADLAAASADRVERAAVPAARTAPAAELSEIRAAVADALAEERERELAEARAFWAAQEARDLAGTGDAHSLLPGLEALADAESEAAESPELAAARRRHPSHPEFSPAPSPDDHERTAERLAELAQARMPLADVRPGPLGTLDVYVFADGTTLCMTPGHRETSERLAGALRDGDEPVLLGGSGVSGAYALTFSCASGTVYVLADRVIASL
ncbi:MULTISPECIES: hypothetical protein [Streptomyces]|uniref:Secreted protein n=1 Tax=Streptomyces morookaense TaxID=1970 RepID=A0A7Y7E9F2_STRMO|nr:MULTISPECIES: hypothetical protein [Streptomyces]MCC2278478.1 hypothetical protein [Streptomyces sp. ET3-23]NVK80356.1 hypothetical protein [Streptomyces morookaense]GHF10709.1 hypothetical protein GCM10010359_10320 [Streptomyces morookaense]